MCGEHLAICSDWRQSLTDSSEVVEKFPDLRSTIIEKLVQTFGEIRSGKVYRGALWIVGEYMDQAAGLFPQHELSYESSSNESTDIQSTFQELRKVLGEIPILASEQKLLDESGGDEDEKPK